MRTNNNERSRNRTTILTPILLLVFIFFLVFSACNNPQGKKADAVPQDKSPTPDQEKPIPRYTRTPAVAGSFYDSQPEVLKKGVEKYINDAPLIPIQGKFIGFMSPHAGYIYSGPIAGYCYKQIQGKKYKTVIVLAPSHRVRLDGVSIIPAGIFKTPLGDVEIDEDLCKKIIAHNPTRIRFEEKSQALEHSLEVQVPFLQVALGDDWKIVPIVYGDNSADTCKMMADAILKNFNPEEQLIMASSDMSHYYPYQTACNMDKPALEEIQSLNIPSLLNLMGEGKAELCGISPVITLMLITQRLKGKAKILHYANSGDTAGDKRQVVGYGAVAFYMPDKEEQEKGEITAVETPDFTVTEEEKKLLLETARKTIKAKLDGEPVKTMEEKDPLLDEELGLFVTLRKGEELRGCIGHCFPVKPLRQALPELAVASAFSDPRFPPLKSGEFNQINIEISLLSPMKRIYDWKEIKIPGHGVYVKRGYRSGVFLPQVADETGWDRETFMKYLCEHKAGISGDAWKKEGTELYIFTVVKFEEGE